MVCVFVLAAAVACVHVLRRKAHTNAQQTLRSLCVFLANICRDGACILAAVVHCSSVAAMAHTSLHALQ